MREEVTANTANTINTANTANTINTRHLEQRITERVTRAVEEKRNATTTPAEENPNPSPITSPRPGVNRLGRSGRSGSTKCSEICKQVLRVVRGWYLAPNSAPPKTSALHGFSRIVPPGFTRGTEDAVRKRRGLPPWKQSHTLETAYEESCPSALYMESGYGGIANYAGLSYDLEQPSHYAVIAASQTMKDRTVHQPFLLYVARTLVALQADTETPAEVRWYMANVVTLAVKLALLSRIAETTNANTKSSLRKLIQQVHEEELGVPMLLLKNLDDIAPSIPLDKYVA